MKNHQKKIALEKDLINIQNSELIQKENIFDDELFLIFIGYTQ